MNQRERSKFLADQKQRLESILAEAPVSRSAILEKVRMHDAADYASSRAEQNLALTSIAEQEGRKALARDAMARIADGTYFNCSECECPISEKRLDALPYATTCIRCAEREGLSSGSDVRIEDLILQRS
jgi:DnaK suppressor protein